RATVQMTAENCTRVTHFILLGLTEHPRLKPVLFALFLGNYVLTLVGNLSIIVLVRVSPQLRTPMYFFLSSLSFLDICYSSTISPKMLLDLSQRHPTISFAGCVVQFHLYALFAAVEVYLLAAMAYDRYVAICNPLLYAVIMSPGLCRCLVAASYLAGLLNALAHTSALLGLSFCGPRGVESFFCDGPPLFVLSSADAWLNEVVMFLLVGFNLAVTNLLVVVSYARVAVTVAGMRSAEGRRRACSTCAAHLAAVAVFYVSAAFNYMQPSARSSMENKKIASLFYSVIVPMLNPLIYSLRNKEVKHAISNIISRK
ncbi:O1052 protein, partial [Nothocercus nigrocapillus]|nr:O1052 protein [Nothocercus nigrocapillus]